MDFDRAIEEAKAAVLPFESWERLSGESSLAFAAFCVFRDYGADRSIRRAVEKAEPDERARGKRYNVWRSWSMQFKWQQRAADFDRYIEKLKQTEIRKTIEAQGEKQREVTGKMLAVVSKKLDSMNPDDLGHGCVPEWVQTAIKAEREAAGLIAANGKGENKQGEFVFASDFNGL